MCVCAQIYMYTYMFTHRREKGRMLDFSHSKLGVYIEDLENTALNLGSIAT